MKLGDIIKVEVSNIGISITEDSPKSVSESERELAGLQYIGGYIVHKLHNNFRNHKNWRDIELYQATTIIGDCRTTKPCENQKLNSVMSRGGLLSPSFRKFLPLQNNIFVTKQNFPIYAK